MTDGEEYASPPAMVAWKTKVVERYEINRIPMITTSSGAGLKLFLDDLLGFGL